MESSINGMLQLLLGGWWQHLENNLGLVFFSKLLRDCDDHKIDQDDEEDDLCQGASIPSIRVGACVTLPPSPGGDKIPTHFPSLNLAHFTLHWIVTTFDSNVEQNPTLQYIRASSHPLPGTGGSTPPCVHMCSPFFQSSQQRGSWWCCLWEFRIKPPTPPPWVIITIFRQWWWLWHYQYNDNDSIGLIFHEVGIARNGKMTPCLSGGPRFKKKFHLQFNFFVIVLVSYFQKGWFLNHLMGSFWEKKTEMAQKMA